ncbi:hypothetical protein [Micromonospora sp. NPDC051296]|uniref:PH domain-containing protein n=1 Tax=Micromonospora sp. NPDC051296 TaxID=3155046 RepID=UPI00342D29A5
MSKRRPHAQVWRTRLWVRIVAVGLPIALASTFLYPELLNPGWTDGMPADELPWWIGLVGVTAVLAFCVLVSRVTVDDNAVRIVNPWGTHEMARASVVDVRPGPYGVEFIGAAGDRHVALAVQCAGTILAKRPRWLELAQSVTGETPDRRQTEQDD